MKKGKGGNTSTHHIEGSMGSAYVGGKSGTKLDPMKGSPAADPASEKRSAGGSAPGGKLGGGR